MIQVQPWTDEDLVKREVKSCDNRDLGEVKQVDTNLLVTQKGSRNIQIPRASVATFDGDKVYLRATEAEVIAGVYPFIESDKTNIMSPSADQTQKQPAP